MFLHSYVSVFHITKSTILIFNLKQYCVKKQGFVLSNKIILVQPDVEA
jgi:hypothetical protein